MNDPSELVALAKRIIDSNRYMTIATIGEDGHPWATPVYFGHGDYKTFYWISSPEAEHSRNVAARSDISIVVFDSSVEIGSAEAVYMQGRTEWVADPTSEECDVAFRPRFRGVRALSPVELRPPAALRLYRTHISKHWVLIRGNDPVWGRGTDSRLEVEL